MTLDDLVLVTSAPATGSLTVTLAPLTLQATVPATIPDARSVVVSARRDRVGVPRMVARAVAIPSPVIRVTVVPARVRRVGVARMSPRVIEVI